MKKNFYGFIIAFMAVAIVASFAGCGNNSTNVTSTKEEKNLDVVILGGQSNALGLSDWEGGT